MPDAQRKRKHSKSEFDRDSREEDESYHVEVDYEDSEEEDEMELEETEEDRNFLVDDDESVEETDHAGNDSGDGDVASHGRNNKARSFSHKKKSSSRAYNSDDSAEEENYKSAKASSFFKKQRARLICDDSDEDALEHDNQSRRQSKGKSNSGYTSNSGDELSSNEDHEASGKPFSSKKRLQQKRRRFHRAQIDEELDKDDLDFLAESSGLQLQKNNDGKKFSRLYSLSTLRGQNAPAENLPSSSSSSVDGAETSSRVSLQGRSTSVGQQGSSGRGVESIFDVDIDDSGPAADPDSSFDEFIVDDLEEDDNHTERTQGKGYNEKSDSYGRHSSTAYSPSRPHSKTGSEASRLQHSQDGSSAARAERHRLSRISDIDPGLSSELFSSNVSQDAIDRWYDVFGDGSDYAYAYQDPAQKSSKSRSDAFLASKDDSVDNNPLEIPDKLPAGARGSKRGITPTNMRSLELPSEYRSDTERTTNDPETNRRTMNRRDGPERIIASKLSEIDNSVQSFSVMWCARAVVRHRLSRESGDFSEKSETAENAMASEIFNSVCFVMLKICNDFMEVPYIAAHQADYWQPDLKEHELWIIRRACDNLRLYYERQTALYTRHSMLPVPDPNFEVLFFQGSKSCEELNDLSDYLSFYHSKELHNSAMQRGQPPQQATLNSKDQSADGGGTRPAARRPSIKPPLRALIYENMRTPLVTKFIDSFCLSVETFLKNLDAGISLYPPPTPAEPISKAFETLESEFGSSESAKLAVVNYVALCLFHSPMLRRQYRTKFVSNGYISTKPTELGKNEVLPGHDFFEFLYLKEKPLESIQECKFLKYLEAEEKGLINIEFDFRDDDLFVSSVTSCYIDVASKEPLVQEWNALRSKIVQEADALLKKCVRSHIRDHMANEAREYLRQACRDELFRLVNVAPCTEPICNTLSTDNSSANGMHANLIAKFARSSVKRPPVCAIAVETNFGQTECAAVILDQNGICLELISILGTETYVLSEKMLKRNCSTVYIGTTSPRTFERLESSLRGAGAADVIIVSERIANAYYDSSVALLDYPNATPLFRKAIGIGLSVLRPLELVALMFPADAKKISLHPDQAYLDERQLCSAMEEALVSATAIVGYDLAQAQTDNKLLHSVLQFIPGLGARSAQILLKRLKQSNRPIRNRNKLYQDGFVSSVVYTNCASFLRIEPEVSHLGEFNPLDGTRIHPENYQYAHKFARDVLEYEDTTYGAETMASTIRTLYTRELGDLDAYNLDDYAEMLNLNYKLRKLCILNEIKAELMNPYRELRPAFQSPVEGYLFTEACGTTNYRISMIVEGEVTYISDKMLRLRLDHTGIDAVVWRRLLPPELQDELGSSADGCSSTLRRGMRVRGAVTQIESARWSVVVSLLPNDIANAQHELERVVDTHFDFRRYEEDRMRSDMQRLNTSSAAENFRMHTSGTSIPADTKNFTSGSQGPNTSGGASGGAVGAGGGKSAITACLSHPLFVQCNREQARQQLQGRECGSALIHPSEHATSHVTVSWVFVREVIQHLEVFLDLQNSKLRIYRPPTYGQAPQGREMAGSAALQDDAAFHDIDELLHRHVQACAKRVHEVAAFRKFHNLRQHDLRDRVVQDYSAKPNTIAYAVGPDHEHPGYFRMLFTRPPLPPQPRPDVVAASVAETGFKVVPKGFVFLGRPYKSLEEVIGAFKNMLGGVPHPPASSAQQAQMPYSMRGQTNSQERSREFEYSHERDQRRDYGNPRDRPRGQGQSFIPREQVQSAFGGFDPSRIASNMLPQGNFSQYQNQQHYYQHPQQQQQQQPYNTQQQAQQHQQQHEQPDFYRSTISR